MRPQKVNDSEIIYSLLKTFRSKGYEGTSLSELEKTTGLKKASLYHRFPNGKKQMATTVLVHLDKWVETNIFKQLLDHSLTPTQRLITGLEQVNFLYDKGNEACIFKVFSIGQSLELFDLQIKNGMTKWIHVFKTLGKSFNLSDEIAQKKAVNILIKIQGSLIVSKGLNDLSIFENTLKEIENMYLNT